MPQSPGDQNGPQVASSPNSKSEVLKAPPGLPGWGRVALLCSPWGRAPTGLAPAPVGDPWGPQVDRQSCTGSPPSTAQMPPGAQPRGRPRVTSPSYAKGPAPVPPLFSTQTWLGNHFPLRFGPPATQFLAWTQQKAKKEMIQDRGTRRSRPGKG